MQKTRSILFLKDVIEQLDQEDSAEIGRSIGFREKDLDKMIQQCRTKYATFTNLQLEVIFYLLRNKDLIEKY